MARFRSIKPEFWTNAQILECTFAARLFFIGLWNFCDDEGRHIVSLKQLKAQIFPADDLDSDSIRRMLDELYENNLIRLYIVDEVEYLEVTGWHHQKIDKKQPSKLPSSSNTNASPYDSTNIRRTFDIERIEREERRGKERRGKKEILSSKSEKVEIPKKEILEIYHNMLPELPCVREISAKRLVHLKSLILNYPDAQNLDWWEVYFQKVRQSDFLMGRQTKWKAGFDFLINYNNMLKVIEGNYESE